MKIYVASSWRCDRQHLVVEFLRARGYDVYGFKNPAPGNSGFGWKQVGLGPYPTAEQFIAALQHPVAEAGYGHDMRALAEADVTVLVLPCGRSAHLEAGYAIGVGQRVAVLLPQANSFEPELMYKMVGWIGTDLDALKEWLG